MGRVPEGCVPPSIFSFTCSFRQKLYQTRMHSVALSGQQTLVELHASETNEDVRMYT